MKDTNIIKTPASIIKRFLAGIIDIGILFVPKVLLVLILKNQWHQLPMLLSISALYFVGFEGSNWHATPGKKALSLIVEKRDGQPLSYGRAFFRWLCPHILYTLYMLALIIVLALIAGLVWMLHKHATFQSLFSSIDPSFLAGHSGKIMFGVVFFFISVTPTVLYILPYFFTPDKLLGNDWMSNTKVVNYTPKE